MTVIARLFSEDKLHELRKVDGKHRLVTFVREPDLDRPMSDEQAGEWVETVLRCGGDVRKGVRDA